MCNFFSAIVLRNGDVLWHEATDSHSDLVAHFQLPDNGECRHFAKVEFTPAEKDGVLQYGEPDSYIMRVDEPTSPSWFEDVRGAVKFARSYGPRYGVSSRRVGVLGMSAGGHLGLLAGTTGDADTRPSAVVAWSAPTQLNIGFSADQPSMRTRYVGCSFTQCTRLWTKLSPTHHASRGDAPTLLFNSTNELLPISQLKVMHKSLRSRGVYVEAHIIRGTRHSVQYANVAWGPTLDFLHEQLAPRRTAAATS